MLEQKPQPNPIHPDLHCPTCLGRLLFHLLYTHHTAADLTCLKPREPTTPCLEHFLTQFYAQLNVYHDQTCRRS